MSMVSLAPNLGKCSAATFSSRCLGSTYTAQSRTPWTVKIRNEIYTQGCKTCQTANIKVTDRKHNNSRSDH